MNGKHDFDKKNQSAMGLLVAKGEITVIFNMRAFSVGLVKASKIAERLVILMAS